MNSVYPGVLLAALAVIFVFLGISPTYRQDWLLENLLVLLPVIELLRSVAPPRGIWRHLMPVLFILSNSAIHELVERAATGAVTSAVLMSSVHLIHRITGRCHDSRHTYSRY